jgi:hypothetical protein
MREARHDPVLEQIRRCREELQAAGEALRRAEAAARPMYHLRVPTVEHDQPARKAA